MTIELPDDWVDDPPSKEIAEILNATDAERCPHDLTCCVNQCGVILQRVEFLRGRSVRAWEPIPKDQRVRWLERITKARAEEQQKHRDMLQAAYDDPRRVVAVGQGPAIIITEASVDRTSPIAIHHRGDGRGKKTEP